MPKILTRIAAVFLVPCLITDPALSCIFQSQQIKSPRLVSFGTQAVVPELVVSEQHPVVTRHLHYRVRKAAGNNRSAGFASFAMTAVSSAGAAAALATPKIFAFLQAADHPDNAVHIWRVFGWALAGVGVSLGVRWYMNRKYRKTLLSQGYDIPNSGVYRLLEVPVEGGTAEQKERVRRLLAELVNLIPRDHVKGLRAVHVGTIPGAGGHVKGFARDRIGVSLEGKDDEVRSTIIHELGHVAYFRSARIRSIWEKIDAYPAAYKILYPMGIIATPILLLLGWLKIWLYVIPDLNQFLQEDASQLMLFVMMMFCVAVLSRILAKWGVRRLIRLFGGPFVTDYATTNAEEDFAESYLIYVTKRADFQKQALHNEMIRRKYEAMQDIFNEPTAPAAGTAEPLFALDVNTGKTVELRYIPASGLDYQGMTRALESLRTLEKAIGYELRTVNTIERVLRNGPWQEPPGGESLAKLHRTRFALGPEGSVEGLVDFYRDGMIGFVAVRPENRRNVGTGRKYKYIGSGLFAAAVNERLRQGDESIGIAEPTSERTEIAGLPLVQRFWPGATPPDRHGDVYLSREEAQAGVENYRHWLISALPTLQKPAAPGDSDHFSLSQDEGAALWSDRFKPLSSKDRQRVLVLADLVIQENALRSEIVEELKEKWGFEIELFIRNQPGSGYIPDLVSAAGLEDQEMLERGRNRPDRRVRAGSGIDRVMRHLSANMLMHGGGKGVILARVLHDGSRSGIEILFRDNGPGLQKIAQAMEYGFTTVPGGWPNPGGYGLSYARDEIIDGGFGDFTIESSGITSGPSKISQREVAGNIETIEDQSDVTVGTLITAIRYASPNKSPGEPSASSAGGRAGSSGYLRPGGSSEERHHHITGADVATASGLLGPRLRERRHWPGSDQGKSVPGTSLPLSQEYALYSNLRKRHDAGGATLRNLLGDPESLHAYLVAIKAMIVAPERFDNVSGNADPLMRGQFARDSIVRDGMACVREIAGVKELYSQLGNEYLDLLNTLLDRAKLPEPDWPGWKFGYLDDSFETLESVAQSAYMDEGWMPEKIRIMLKDRLLELVQAWHEGTLRMKYEATQIPRALSALGHFPEEGRALLLLGKVARNEPRKTFRNAAENALKNAERLMSRPAAPVETQPRKAEVRRRIDPPSEMRRRTSKPETPSAPDARWFEQAAAIMSSSFRFSEFNERPQKARDIIEMVRTILGDTDAFRYMQFWLQIAQPADETFKSYAASVETFRQDVRGILPLMRKVIDDPKIGAQLAAACHEIFTFILMTANAVDAIARIDSLGSLRQRTLMLSDRWERQMQRKRKVKELNRAG